MVDMVPRSEYPRYWNQSLAAKLYMRAVGQTYSALRKEFWLDYEVLRLAHKQELMRQEGLDRLTKKQAAKALHRAERALAAMYRDRYHEILLVKRREVTIAYRENGK